MPLGTKKEKAIFQKAIRAFELTVKSVQSFRSFLSEDHAPQSPEYYMARNFLRDAETLYEEAVAEAKKLLGPLPGYVSSQLADSKKVMLEAMSVVAKSADLASLQSELERDEFIAGMFRPEEIAVYVRSNFENQRKGKRRLPNIKARMAIEKLGMKLALARGLRDQAQEKHQAPTASSRAAGPTRPPHPASNGVSRFPPGPERHRRPSRTSRVWLRPGRPACKWPWSG